MVSGRSRNLSTSLCGILRYNTMSISICQAPFYIFSSAFYIFFQVDGENNNSIGNSSRRPASISNISTNLDKIEKPPKLQVGPTAPSPGPMLFKVAATAVKFDVKSKLSRLTISTDAAYRKKYVIKYAFTELTTDGSITFPSVFSTLTLRG